MQPKKTELKDYRPPTHLVSSMELWFDLFEDHTEVRQRSQYQQAGASTELFLDGSQLECISIRLNDTTLVVGSENCQLSDSGLLLRNLPSHFVLEIHTRIYPQSNTSLEGLYKSSSYFCTQCEAQGFRRITYFQDRPDVLTKYKVHISADQQHYPILLSNGNRIFQQKLDNGRHSITWEDPFNKPTYLFALVAGDLGVLRDEFKTMSGRTVQLEIYSALGTQERCRHAMESLKKAMRWDEVRFGREYDLDIFMILAVDDFNSGAMENKGLNIFNSRLIFADAETATDEDYFNIESVIGHEYFHNWTGNRVTVRDWFHLSLKEGLTVFRDQEFSMDMSSREKVRIDNVSDLRSIQFVEDAGPNAHPIRPESCYAVDNFYTPTIYEKGAEVIRMMQTLVGRPGFRKGMDLYFEKFDGKAVVIEDFAKAIADANSQEWTQFQRWYSQKGTPRVSVQESYEPKDKTYSVSLRQNMQPPLHIPLVMGLLSPDGQEMAISPQPGLSRNSEGQWTLHLQSEQQTWKFENCSESPVLSLNRQFSAPITLDWNRTTEKLSFLLENDTDSFNRWESEQQLLVTEFRHLIADHKHVVPKNLLTSLKKVLTSDNLPEDFRSSLLQFPDDSFLLQQTEYFSAEKFLHARNSLEQQISGFLREDLQALYVRFHGKNLSSKDPREFGRRALKNLALGLLANHSEFQEQVFKQFTDATIMTDELAAYEILSDIENYATAAHRRFHEKWQSESLVLNKWFTVQAHSLLPSTFENVIRLSQHPDFQIQNPNRVYSLLRAFGQNLVRFHDPTKDTYSFMGDKIIEIDKFNPQVATRLAGSFNIWKKLEPAQRPRAHRQLERMMSAGLSKNTYEIVKNQLTDNNL